MGLHQLHRGLEVLRLVGFAPVRGHLTQGSVGGTGSVAGTGNGTSRCAGAEAQVGTERRPLGWAHWVTDHI